MAETGQGTAAAALGRLMGMGETAYVRLHTGGPPGAAEDSGPAWTPVSGEGWSIEFPPGIVLRSGESLVITREIAGGGG